MARAPVLCTWPASACSPQPCLQAPGSEAQQQVDSKLARTVRLATEQLVPALNEHVRLRALASSPCKPCRMVSAGAQ